MVAEEEERVESDDLDGEEQEDELNGHGNRDKADDSKVTRTKKKKKKKDGKYQNVGGKRGVCYLSRVPPHMDPRMLRQILSQYGDIERIYLAPEDPMAQMHRKKAGGFRGKQFSEGWVEFTKRSVAKQLANTLNGEQIGGKKRSQFYYDIWNIRYLRKFTWDDLTSEIAEKSHIREQKREMEASAAKRERDFYLAKVEQSQALSSIEERIKKKRKTEESEPYVKEHKVIRHFQQIRPVAEDVVQKKQRLSKDFLAGLLGGGDS